jgi:hypothetical protein
MVGRLGPVALATAVWLALATACGGRSTRYEADDASGGTGGSGGSDATGGSGATGGTDGRIRCVHDGVAYEVGETFDGENCRPCRCANDGVVVCGVSACSTCESFPPLYSDALLEARRCDPTLRVEQCTVVATSHLVCGCPTYVERDDELLSLMASYQSRMCSGPIGCGACPTPPVRGECRADGVCVDVRRGLPVP